MPTFPAAGETVFRIAEFPPDAVYPKDAQDTIFDEIDGKAEAADGAKHSDGKHFWFHRTDSLDYAIVLEGEITLLVDDGEATLKAGDVAVQRATSHAWSNRTDRIAGSRSSSSVPSRSRPMPSRRIDGNSPWVRSSRDRRSGCR